MKVLGRGWQYTTYDLGGNRVLKRYNSKLAAYAVMAPACLTSDRLSLFEIPAYYRSCRDFALSSMKLIATDALEAWMMGNPKILNELDYEQDKMTPLHERINGSDVKEAKTLVDKFVEFNKKLIERSLIDKSFNITKNFGIDGDERVVLMDLGELYADSESINKQRRKRQWTYPYVAGAIEDKEVKAYYVEEMDKVFGLPPAPQEM